MERDLKIDFGDGIVMVRPNPLLSEQEIKLVHDDIREFMLGQRSSREYNTLADNIGRCLNSILGKAQVRFPCIWPYYHPNDDPNVYPYCYNEINWIVGLIGSITSAGL